MSFIFMITKPVFWPNRLQGMIFSDSEENTWGRNTFSKVESTAHCVKKVGIRDCLFLISYFLLSQNRVGAGVPFQRGKENECYIDFKKITTRHCSFRIKLICLEWQLSNRKFALQFSSPRSSLSSERAEAEPELSCLFSAGVSCFHALSPLEINHFSFSLKFYKSSLCLRSRFLTPVILGMF